MMAMKKYQATAVVVLCSGKVKLTKDQAASRSHLLEQVNKKGVFKIVDTIQFKAGENFSFDGEIPKGIADDLEAVDGKSSSVSEVTIDEIVNVIAGLDVDSETDYIAPGKPNLEVIKGFIKNDVTQEQCDEAYALFEKQSNND